MKKQQPLLLGIILYMALSLIGISTIAQTLTIKGRVLLNDRSTMEMVKVSVVEIDSDSATTKNTTTYDCVKGFEIILEDNKEYLVVVQKKGFQAKAIAVSTNHTSNKLYKYTFFINLIDTEPVIDNPVFAGGIFYSKKKNNFDFYLSSYVTH